MAGESDQTRWVGTRKVYPAIGDLQAPESFVRAFIAEDNVGANYNQLVYHVPDGKMLMLQAVSCWCFQADPTSVVFNLKTNDYYMAFHAELYGVAFTTVLWNGNILVNEDEDIRIQWYGSIATTDVVGMCFGYLIDKY